MKSREIAESFTDEQQAEFLSLPVETSNLFWSSIYKKFLELLTEANIVETEEIRIEAEKATAAAEAAAEAARLKSERQTECPQPPAPAPAPAKPAPAPAPALAVKSAVKPVS